MPIWGIAYQRSRRKSKDLISLREVKSDCGKICASGNYKKVQLDCRKVRSALQRSDLEYDWVFFEFGSHPLLHTTYSVLTRPGIPSSRSIP
eukprot:2140635-Rhodomonas_salina.1